MSRYLTKFLYGAPADGPSADDAAKKDFKRRMERFEAADGERREFLTVSVCLWVLRGF